MTKQHVESFLEEKYVIFNTVAGISIMAVILDELEDSFIVGLPARLVRQKGTISAEPYLPELISRFYKYTLLNHVPLSDTFELPYLNYIADNGHRVGLPKEGIESIRSEIESLVANSDRDVVELPSHVDYLFPETREVH